MSDFLQLFQPEIGEWNAPAPVDLSRFDWGGGVLLRSPNWLGDAVMAFPGMYRLREQLPAGVPCTVLCPNKLVPLWKCVTWVDRVIGFGGRRLTEAELTSLRHLSPGLTVILPNSFGSAWDLWRAGLSRRLGRRGRGRSLMLDIALPEYVRRPGRDRWHQARYYLEFAACCGARDWGCSCPSLTAEIPACRRKELLGDNVRSLLVIAPGAAYGPAKQWPVSHFRAVADWWSREVGPVLSTGAPGEEAIARQVVEGLNPARVLAGKTSLAELVYVLGQARCVLANDSGTMHLAAATGRDGVAIFGSTDPLATGPVGGRWVVARHPVPCSPCLKRACPLAEERYACLSGITSDTVIHALQQLLESGK